MCRLYFRNIDDDKAKEILANNTALPPYTYDCYSCYPSYYQSDKDMYFGFYTGKRVKILIDLFNKVFKNIKVILIGINKFPFKSEYGIGFHDKDHTNRYSNYMPEKCDYAIFKIEVSKKYTNEARFTLVIAIAQFIRAFCVEYAHYSRVCVLKSITLESIINAFNTFIGYEFYGCWSGKTQFDLETFMKLDNIKLMNNITKYVDLNEMPKNSDLVTAITKNKYIGQSAGW